MRGDRSLALWAITALLAVSMVASEVACGGGGGSHGSSGGSGGSEGAIPLGAAEDFAILGGGGISNVPTSAITGDIGVSPAAGSTLTGFSSPLTCPEVTGDVFKVGAGGPACATINATLLDDAKDDLTDAFNDAAGRTVPAPVAVSGNLGGQTLTPGIYKSTSSLMISSGNLTLSGSGAYIFQIASTLTTIGCGASVPCTTGGNVILTNGANASNVFWQVGSSATIGQYTNFEGSILAYADVSINTGARITGRLLSGAQPSGAGMVSLISNTVTMP